MRNLSNCLLAFTLFASHVAAETYAVSDAMAFNRAVAAAQPGDTIFIAADEYENSFSFTGVHGK